MRLESNRKCNKKYSIANFKLVFEKEEEPRIN